MPNARIQATKTLLSILGDGMRPKPAIDAAASDLDRRDRAFLMEIVYGVLRYRDTLDWILGHFLRSPADLSNLTLNNLRVAVYQLFFMRVPQWAAVNEAVEAEKEFLRTDKAAKPPVVNGALRNLLRKKDQYSFPLSAGDPAGDIALNTSHPRWLINSWIARYGTEQTRCLAEANNKIPPFTIRTNTLKTDRSSLAELLRQHGLSAGETGQSPEGIVLDPGTTYDDLCFAEGLFAVQDEASQLISHLLGPQPGERVLDACAAPGGKATHIAQLMNDTGEVVAVEKDPARIGQIHQNINTLGIRSVRVINADVSALGADAGTFDRILLDAPCSATGVIRRNPDVKYRHNAADLLRFGKKQLMLLRSVSGLLDPGGRLVYAVCSTEPEEGEQVVEEFLKEKDDFGIIDAGKTMFEDLARAGRMRTFPHKHNMDGFFAAVLCRKD